MFSTKTHSEVDVIDTRTNTHVYGPSIEYININTALQDKINEIAQRKAGVYQPYEFDPASFTDAWTVVGKSNDDIDRNIIKNLTGNGNDLTLKHFTFSDDNGYSGGYLITNGIDNVIDSKYFRIGSHFTLIGEWQFQPTNVNLGSGIVKYKTLYIYNHINGITVYIKDNVAHTKFENIDSLKAVCSDGRCYDKEFNQLIVKKVGTNSNVSSALKIGEYGDYTKVLFKNLAIYDRVLSKEECILAYNYLQTLKAKKRNDI